jgi:hypothetical protein
MGLVWSDYRKVKNDSTLLTKATITPEVKDDVWLLWKAVKSGTKKQQLRDDGFSIGKDQFDGNRWKVLWFYTIEDDSYDEVKGVPKWRIERERLTQKWILELASIKDAIADENSEDSDEVDSYNAESSDEVVVKKVPKVKKGKAPVRKTKK